MSAIESHWTNRARLACGVIVAANVVAIPTLAGRETVGIHVLLAPPA